MSNKTCNKTQNTACKTCTTVAALISILFQLAANDGVPLNQNKMLMRATTVVQVLQDSFYVLLHVLFYLRSLLKCQTLIQRSLQRNVVALWQHCSLAPSTPVSSILPPRSYLQRILLVELRRKHCHIAAYHINNTAVPAHFNPGFRP